MLSDRETASLIWLAVGLGFALSKREIRASLRSVVRAFLQPAIVISVATMCAYIAAEVWAGVRLSLWSPALLKPTILWATFSGIALLFDASNAKDASFYRRKVRATIGVAVFIEFFVNLQELGLLVEIVLQPFVALLAMTSVVADRQEHVRAAKKVCDGLLIVVGLTLVILTARQVYGGWATLDRSQLALDFFLPIWLTVGFLPFILVFSLILAYDRALRGINWATEDSRSRWRARLALAAVMHFRVGDLHAFPWYLARNMTAAQDLVTARQVLRDFLSSRREEESARAGEAARLARHAGSDGVDDQGRRLDRREFKETIDALRFLETCQMGQYRQQGRYNTDVLKWLGGDFSHGLPKEAGIVMAVAKDRKRWYAWRRTVSGWCFAIGASEPPPDQWEYDGPEPPQDFPGRDPRWGAGPFSDEVNRNWS